MKKLNLDVIRIDGGTQPRERINMEVVADYAEAVKIGIEFPAVIVFHDGAEYWLADGFHRWHAHKQAGKASIEVDVRSGTNRDALLFALSANGDHGLRLTNDDKHRIVGRMLVDEEWAKWSQERIAKHCHVSPGFVSKLVAGRRASLHGEEIKPATRTVERAGKTYQQDTSRIGKHAQATSAAKAGPQAPTLAKPANKLVSTAPLPDLAFELAESQSAVGILADENDRLNDRLAVESMDASEEEKLKAAATIAELRAELKTANAELKAVRAVRDDYMRENGQLKKTVASLQRKLKKVEEPA